MYVHVQTHLQTHTHIPVTYYMLHIAYRRAGIAYYILQIAYCKLHITYEILHISYRIVHITNYLLPITYIHVIRMYMLPNRFSPSLCCSFPKRDRVILNAGQPLRGGMGVRGEPPSFQESSWTSNRPKTMAPYPKMESTGSIGSIILGLLEVQVVLKL